MHLTGVASMKINLSVFDRALRTLVGLMMIAFAVSSPTTVFSNIGWLGILPILSALIGWCGVYWVYDVSTWRRPQEH